MLSSRSLRRTEGNIRAPTPGLQEETTTDHAAEESEDLFQLSLPDRSACASTSTSVSAAAGCPAPSCSTPGTSCRVRVLQLLLQALPVALLVMCRGPMGGGLLLLVPWHREGRPKKRQKATRVRLVCLKPSLIVP